MSACGLNSIISRCSTFEAVVCYMQRIFSSAMIRSGSLARLFDVRLSSGFCRITWKDSQGSFLESSVA